MFGFNVDLPQIRIPGIGSLNRGIVLIALIHIGRAILASQPLRGDSAIVSMLK